MKKSSKKNQKKFHGPHQGQFSNLEFWTENFWTGSPKDGEYEYNHENALILLLRPLWGAKNGENRDFGLIWAKKSPTGGQNGGQSKNILAVNFS